MSKVAVVKNSSVAELIADLAEIVERLQQVIEQGETHETEMSDKIWADAKAKVTNAKRVLVRGKRRFRGKALPKRLRQLHDMVEAIELYSNEYYYCMYEGVNTPWSSIALKREGDDLPQISTSQIYAALPHQDLATPSHLPPALQKLDQRRQKANNIERLTCGYVRYLYSLPRAVGDAAYKGAQDRLYGFDVPYLTRPGGSQVQGEYLRRRFFDILFLLEQASDVLAMVAAKEGLEEVYGYPPGLSQGVRARLLEGWYFVVQEKSVACRRLVPTPNLPLLNQLRSCTQLYFLKRKHNASSLYPLAEAWVRRVRSSKNKLEPRADIISEDGDTMSWLIAARSQQAIMDLKSRIRARFAGRRLQPRYRRALRHMVEFVLKQHGISLADARANNVLKLESTAPFADWQENVGKTKFPPAAVMEKSLETVLRVVSLSKLLSKRLTTCELDESTRRCHEAVEAHIKTLQEELGRTGRRSITLELSTWRWLRKKKNSDLFQRKVGSQITTVRTMALQDKQSVAQLTQWAIDRGHGERPTELNHRLLEQKEDRKKGYQYKLHQNIVAAHRKAAKEKQRRTMSLDGIADDSPEGDQRSSIDDMGLVLPPSLFELFKEVAGSEQRVTRESFRPVCEATLSVTETCRSAAAVTFAVIFGKQHNNHLIKTLRALVALKKSWQRFMTHYELKLTERLDNTEHPEQKRRIRTQLQNLATTTQELLGNQHRGATREAKPCFLRRVQHRAQIFDFMIKLGTNGEWQNTKLWKKLMECQTIETGNLELKYLKDLLGLEEPRALDYARTIVQRYPLTLQILLERQLYNHSGIKVAQDLRITTSYRRPRNGEEQQRELLRNIQDDCVRAEMRELANSWIHSPTYQKSPYDREIADLGWWLSCPRWEKALVTDLRGELGSRSGDSSSDSVESVLQGLDPSGRGEALAHVTSYLTALANQQPTLKLSCLNSELAEVKQGSRAVAIFIRYLLVASEQGGSGASILEQEVRSWESAIAAYLVDNEVPQDLRKKYNPYYLRDFLVRTGVKPLFYDKVKECLEGIDAGKPSAIAEHLKAGKSAHDLNVWEALQQGQAVWQTYLACSYSYRVATANSNAQGTSRSKTHKKLAKIAVG